MKRVNRYFPAWRYQEEEAWLNRMSDEGWQLREVALWAYTFDKGEKSAHRYCLELIPHLKGSDKYEDYIGFLNDSGIELVTSVFFWGYFRRANDGKPFEMYSDLDSRVKHINRVFVQMGFAALLLIYSLVNMLSIMMSGGFGWLGAAVILLFYAAAIAFIISGTVRLFKKRQALIRERALRE